MSKATKNAPATTAPVTAEATATTPKAAPPKSALTFKGYAPEARALVQTIATHASAAASAGLTLATALAEAFAMDLWKVTGHSDDNAWAVALLAEAAPEAGRSTIYAWVETAHGICGVRKAGQDVALFPTDTLRIVGSRKVAGQDPAQMAKVVAELVADPKLRNKAGRIDPYKARAHVDPKSGGKAEDPSVTLAERALKAASGDHAKALTMLAEAMRVVEAQRKVKGKGK
jgi:hypothetical protein